MTLDPNTWTHKTREAVEFALASAREHSNPEATPDHLLAALLRQEDGVVLPIVAKVGIEPVILRNAADSGAAEYDLLRGDEPYKSHFRAVPQPSRELLIAHRHLGGRLGYHALTGGRRLRTWARGLRGFLQDRLRPGAE